MHNIVVLGTGIAAAPVIRQTMRNTVLPSNDYKLYVVTPSAHFHYPIAMPRAIVPGQFANDKFMFPLEPHFREYPATKFEFVLGKAANLDPDAKVVQISLNDGGSQSITYDTLIIATGTASKEGLPWKALDTTEKTEERLRALQDEIKKAKTVVVAGGGTTGVETAGEIAFEYAQRGQKEVYLIHNDALPLTPFNNNVRKAAKSELDKLKVKSIPNTQVTSVTRSGNDYVLELRHSDGSVKTLKAQAYVPATGMTPNTSFAPASMLDQYGQVKQTAFLQAEGYSNIFVVGDAGNLQDSTAFHAGNQALHLIKALPLYFKGEKFAKYEVSDKVTAAITIGRSRGTGQVGNMKLFSLLVWYLKGRHLGTDGAPALPSGKKAGMTVLEK